MQPSSATVVPLPRPAELAHRLLGYFLLPFTRLFSERLHCLTLSLIL